MPNREPQTALVLGGAGFVGSWVIRCLVADGVDVISVDREAAGRVPPGASSVALEPRDPQRQLAALFAEQRIDVALCLVGSGDVPRSFADPLADLTSNAALPLAFLQSLRAVPEPPSALVVSSAAVYGEARTTPMDESHPLAPLSPYGISKLAIERYAALYHELYGLPVSIARPFSLYGPGQRKLVVHDLLVRLLAGEDPLVVRAPAAVTRDLLYVEDAARMLIAIARAGSAGATYNVCSGTESSLAELGTALVEATGTGARVEFTGRLRAGDPSRWVGDPSRAATLGVTAAVELDDGLARTAAWLRSNAG